MELSHGKLTRFREIHVNYQYYDTLHMIKDSVTDFEMSQYSVTFNDSIVFHAFSELINELNRMASNRLN